MPRYFFSLADLEPPEGQTGEELPDDESARRIAAEIAAQLAGMERRPASIAVYNERGQRIR